MKKGYTPYQKSLLKNKTIETPKVPLDPSKYPALKDLTVSEAKEMLWRRGDLTWKLNSMQKRLYRKFLKEDHKINVWNISRQVGKSFTLTIMALQTCFSSPGSQVKYCAGDAKSVGKIIKPTIRKLLEDCPADIKPKWKREGGCYEFPNGSLLYLEGIDGGKADSLRGTPAHLLIIDEAGFISDLDYAMSAVLLPMTTTTKGRILVVSTPPKNAGHDLVKIIERADYEGAYTKKTVYDYLEEVKNDPPFFKDRITLEEVERLKKASTPSNWRREYLGEIEVDRDHVVIPEFTAEVEKECVVKWNRPKKFDYYVSMDLGVRDMTAIIWAYFDYMNNKLVIEGEYSVSGAKVTVSHIAQSIRDKENQLYRNPNNGLIKEPFKRISDNNEIIARQDLATNHDIIFVPTRKDDKNAALHDLRDRIHKGQIIIDPSCKDILFHIKNATWNNRKTSFDRSPEGGHYDYVDALIYLVRNIDWHKNPFPSEWGGGSNMFRGRDETEVSENAQIFTNIFKKRK